jgi:hypothetical protein
MDKQIKKNIDEEKSELRDLEHLKKTDRKRDAICNYGKKMKELKRK